MQFLASPAPLLSAALLFALLPATSRADTEWNGGGDLREFRFQGEPVGLTGGIRMTSTNGTQSGPANLRSPGRAGSRVEFTGTVGFGDAAGGRRGGAPGAGAAAGGPGVNLQVTTVDVAPDTTTFDVQATADTALPLEGLYYTFNLSGDNFAAGTAVFGASGSSNAAPRSVSLGLLPPGVTHYADDTVSFIRFTHRGNHNAEFTFPNPTPVVLLAPAAGGRGGPRPAATLLIPIATGTLSPGTTYHLAFTLKAACDLDTTPVTLALDPARTGPAFLGVGGNFRLQSPADPATIAYNLEHLHAVWARLEMPLSSWQTTATADPAAAPLAANVRSAMEMARTLAQKNIPMIISDWSAPAWAVATNGGRGGGRTIASDQWPAMYQGITSYLVYLKKNYGAEPRLFSFNEADMGINVKLTPEDQATVIKGLGAAFAGAGLVTRPLLGDTGNPAPKPANYLDPALADPEAMKFVGALSFHCWTGGSDEVIARWGRIAQQFKLPLLVAEGGTDPNSYRYRNVFLEPWYALDEINLYVRCLALARPASILHWQYTDDYSLLTGGRNGQPLRPTQRFFNLQQLNLTPPAAPSLGLTGDHPRLTAAAYGDDQHGWAIHLVNTGATRDVTLTALPATLTQLYPTLTDGARQMEALPPVPVSAGTARFPLPAQAFVTLTSAR